MIPCRDLDFLSVPRFAHVDQFFFHIIHLPLSTVIYLYVLLLLRNLAFNNVQNLSEDVFSSLINVEELYVTENY